MENQISIKALQLNAVDDIISQHRKTASVLRREGYSYPSISQKVVHFKTAYLSSLGPVPIQINTKQIRNIYSASTVAKNVENHEALRQKCLSCDDLVTFKYEYKYDDNDNWISKISYRVIDGKTEKILKIKRKIKYAT